MIAQSGSFQGYKMSYKFNASHNFSKNEAGKHAHTFCVDVFIRKNSDAFAEFTVYENYISKYLKKFQKKYLNDMPEFNGNIPTLENMCMCFYREIERILKEQDEFTLLRIELGDNPITSVSVGEEIVINSSNLFIPLKSFNLFKQIVALSYRRNRADNLVKQEG